ncbi:uncharacterized protein RHIMIDRAFT_278433 [Rhizopus microsporus ATCC 52813]|uniref:Ubiquitin-conjugating enzyme E2-binding protein n=1 Tax=Rhizopus microsporus ATCC 52813 TaxID=1340429 RepID=A0A2G4SZM3_RHIZD|nr:uncharacterized protein RHIMIDRAFT_278433 [Rhizopus microsporus ATCC 52813]PHZ14204.1 hypothetical protein RHIMIDRAFT_278433 [Rhizopus microsporus ATCC 52813]
MIPFYAEELGNINIVRATILAEPEYDVAKQLQVADNQLILDSETKIDLSTVGLSISPQDWIVSRVDQPTDGLVPWEVKLSQCRQTQQPRSQQTEVKEWWSTSVLRELSEFQCKVCAQPLFLKDKEYKLKDLPSEHWYELVECWICHETKPEEHQARMRPILARPTVLLVGSTYFLLHPDDIIANSTQMDKVVADRLNWERGTMTKWIAINCSHCQQAVGEGQYCIENDQIQLLAVKLFKYSISILPNLQEQPGFIDFFVSDLISTAKIHATHKFLIQGRQSTRHFALIWLFNWDTSIIYNNKETLKKERVIKITYLDCTNDKDEHVAKSIQLWSNDRSADQLVYPDAYCNQLLESLKESTLILPSFMRQMNHPAMPFVRNFSVGFIPRRS